LTSDGGAPPGAPLGAKALGLLAFLALEPGAHRRERVTALLWGDSPEEKARASLRQALSHLRDALGGLLRVDRTTVALEGPLECDVTEFLRRASEDPPSALAIDVPAFLESLTIRNCRAFDEWVEERRAGLAARYVALLGTVARDAMARRAWLEAAQLGERWARLAPLADEPIAVQMEARFLAGDRAGALALHARHLARLEADGASGTGRALAALAARIERSPSRDTGRRATESWYEHAPSFDSSLVGREREWDTLKRAWESLGEGGSRVVLVEGEPHQVGGRALVEVAEVGPHGLRAEPGQPDAVVGLGHVSRLLRWCLAGSFGGEGNRGGTGTTRPTGGAILPRFPPRVPRARRLGSLREQPTARAR